jgi:hypothetical protein
MTLRIDPLAIRSKPRPRPVAAVGVALLMVGALLLSASDGTRVAAATKPAPPEPAATQRFALTPTGPDPSQPGKRTTFTFTQAHGSTVSDRVSLFNYSDQPIAFQLYGNDAFDTAEGQLDVKRADQKPTDAGSWVKLKQGALVVPPNSAVTEPFVVIVPKGASPGDHAAGIIASVKGAATTPTGQTVAIDERVGVPVYVRVLGPLRPGLSIVGLESHYHRSSTSLGGGTLDVSYRVRNTGNVRLAGHQKIDIEAPFGWVTQQKREPDVPELVPGGSIAVTAHFTHVLPTLRVTTVVHVTPYSKEGPIRPAPHPTSASSSVWAIPWTDLLILAVLVGLGVWWFRRRRQRPSAAPSPSREPVLTGATEGSG